LLSKLFWDELSGKYIQKDQIVFPVLNCIDGLGPDYILYLGYANTALQSFNINEIGDNYFKCGSNFQSPDFIIQEYGQYNFQLKIVCNDSFVWSLNGSILTIDFKNFKDKTCRSIDRQTITFDTPGIPSFSDTQLNQFLYNLQILLNVNSSRLNITQRNIDIGSNEGELIVSIAKSNGSEPEHSEVAYNFSSYKPSDIQKLFQNSTINVNKVGVKVLSYNESVAVDSGCFAKDDTNLLQLTYIDAKQCIVTSNSKDTTEQSTVASNESWTTILLIIVVIIVVLAIIFAILAMAIPSIRSRIFPRVRIRNGIKKKLEED